MRKSSFQFSILLLILYLLLLKVTESCIKCAQYKSNFMRTGRCLRGLGLTPFPSIEVKQPITPLQNQNDFMNYIFDNKEEKNEEDLKKTLISWVQWYKDTLSPIMPPNCRFLPSCSSYSIESIQKFGPAKGLMLTAWRLLRCNPFGGSGYDPPQWPPPDYNAGSTSKSRW